MSGSSPSQQGYLRSTSNRGLLLYAAKSLEESRMIFESNDKTDDSEVQHLLGYIKDVEKLARKASEASEVGPVIAELTFGHHMESDAEFLQLGEGAPLWHLFRAGQELYDAIFDFDTRMELMPKVDAVIIHSKDVARLVGGNQRVYQLQDVLDDVAIVVHRKGKLIPGRSETGLPLDASCV